MHKNIFKKVVSTVLIAGVCITSVFAAKANNMKTAVDNLNFKTGTMTTKIVMTEKDKNNKDFKTYDADILLRKSKKDFDLNLSLNEVKDTETLRPIIKSPVFVNVTKRGDNVKIGLPELVMSLFTNFVENGASPEEINAFNEMVRSNANQNYILINDADKKEKGISKEKEEQIKKLIEGYRPLYLKVKGKEVSFNLDKEKAINELENVKKYVIKNANLINSIYKEDGDPEYRLSQEIIENIDEEIGEVRENLKSFVLKATPERNAVKIITDDGATLTANSKVDKTKTQLKDFTGRELTEDETTTYGFMIFALVLSQIETTAE